MNEVEYWYDHEYDEWERLNRHKIEFDITKRYLDEFIIGDNLEIFDIGGGPGRYAIHLAERGHKVTLLDLSKKNIEVAKQKSFEKGITLGGYIHGNALELEGMDHQYDVVLLMGPLYHLIKESERRKAVEGAINLLKPNGIMIVTFISSYAPLQDHLMNLYPIESVQEILGYFQIGENKGGNGFTTAYFTKPNEARKFMDSTGLKELKFAGIENVLGYKEKEITFLEDGEYRKWIEIGYRLSTDEYLLGTSQHLLYIGRKL
ncbi:methyltransferase domain-containing protein [Bacillus sp. ISL-41]|uniref:class I SAM-dependent methyltransferase n=1 Tax=Bacillus sp. ISL-41 TaxID=2819127 RepID=UPI001BE5C139|nr:class I SAM-dependent methyltransferase [Bacillus sp. ISL-41]MBT2641530.1 methyltransferase domain-containing protein [Bacillus sp. ISL-41]